MSYPGASQIPYAVVEERTFVRRVYVWMTGGLAITALVSLFIASNDALVGVFVRNPMLLLVTFLAELGLVLYLTAGIARMSPGTAAACFALYSALNGVVFSLIFRVYTPGSVASTFVVTAGTFGVMSLYGYFTKKDLTSIGHLCMMGVLGLFLALIVNGIFVRSAGFDLVISCLGVLIFVGLTAYDTQKIKKIHALGEEGTAADKKAAIIGALRLYLDFINLFIFLLHLMNRRR